MRQVEKLKRKISGTRRLRRKPTTKPPRSPPLAEDESTLKKTATSSDSVTSTSKTSVSKSSVREKKEKDDTEEDAPSTQQQINKKKKGSKNPKGLSDEAAASVDAFATFIKEAPVSTYREEWETVAAVVPDDGTYSKHLANPDRNRNSEFWCLDESRIVLAPPQDPKGGEPDYIHANKVTIDKAERDYVAAEAPKANTLEEFWRMVFQESAPAVLLLCQFFEDGTQKCDEFFPMEAGQYKYYGKMFINNKKVEHQDHLTIYTLEVLPEGCSNSLVTRLLHCCTWPEQGSSTDVHVLRIIRFLKGVELGTAVVVSGTGTGRAAVYIAAEGALSRLFKGHDTKVVDLVLGMRKQLALAVQSELQYLNIYTIMARYVKAYVPKHGQAMARLFEKIRELGQ